MQYRTLKYIAKVFKANGYPVSGCEINKDGSYDIFFSRPLTDEETKDANSFAEMLGLDAVYLKAEVQ